jgi:hypothetical protein
MQYPCRYSYILDRFTEIAGGRGGGEKYWNILLIKLMYGLPFEACITLVGVIGVFQGPFYIKFMAQPWKQDWGNKASRLLATLSLTRRKIRLIESNAKCRYLKKLTCTGTLRQVVICLRPPSPTRFIVWGGKAIL